MRSVTEDVSFLNSNIYKVVALIDTCCILHSVDYDCSAGFSIYNASSIFLRFVIKIELGLKPSINIERIPVFFTIRSQACDAL